MISQIEIIFSSPLLPQDPVAWHKFKTRCLSSDYAISLVDKAIQARQKLPPNDHYEPAAGFAETDSKEAFDLMKQLLCVHPDDRMNADDAIKHAYVLKFYNPSLEDKVCPRVVLPEISDDTQLSIDAYRGKLYEIIQIDKCR